MAGSNPNHRCLQTTITHKAEQATTSTMMRDDYDNAEAKAKAKERIEIIRKRLKQGLEKEQVREKIASVLSSLLLQPRAATTNAGRAAAVRSTGPAPIYQSSDALRRDEKGLRTRLSGFVRRVVWSKMGVRFVDKTEVVWRAVVKKALVEDLRISDPAYYARVHPMVDRLLRAILRNRLSVAQNNYRRKIRRMIGVYRHCLGVPGGYRAHISIC